MTAAHVDDVRIRQLETMDEAAAAQLADVLIDCVDGGASVSFMHPLAQTKARAFWQALAADIAAGAKVLFVAEDAAGIVGTVQLVLNLPENQPHRGDISKMLVHRRGRRRGIGAALMRAAEECAQSLGRTLLVLDTVPGSAAARLYERLGWTYVGTIPDFALWPNGGLTPTNFYYRKLA